ncbi:MAG: cupin domain-containing protein [Gemmatimonas sp.]
MRMQALVLALLVTVPASLCAQGKPAAPAPAAAAAPSPLKRTILQTHSLVTQPAREAITALAELEVGGTAPRHIHTGEEIGYVVQGTGIVEMEGQPPRTVKAGDVFFVPPNTPHLVRNTGKVVWKGVSTYLIEKGQPLAVAAPAKP